MQACSYPHGKYRSSLEWSSSFIAELPLTSRITEYQCSNEIDHLIDPIAPPHSILSSHVLIYPLTIATSSSNYTVAQPAIIITWFSSQKSTKFEGSISWKAEALSSCSVEKSEPFDSDEFSQPEGIQPVNGFSLFGSSFHKIFSFSSPLMPESGFRRVKIAIASPVASSLSLTHPPWPQPVVMEITVLLYGRNCLTAELSFESAISQSLGNTIHSPLHVLGIQTPSIMTLKSFLLFTWFFHHTTEISPKENG